MLDCRFCHWHEKPAQTRASRKIHKHAHTHENTQLMNSWVHTYEKRKTPHFMCYVECLPRCVVEPEISLPLPAPLCSTGSAYLFQRHFRICRRAKCIVYTLFQVDINPSHQIKKQRNRTHAHSTWSVLFLTCIRHGHKSGLVSVSQSREPQDYKLTQHFILRTLGLCACVFLYVPWGKKNYFSVRNRAC